MPSRKNRSCSSMPSFPKYRAARPDTVASCGCSMPEPTRSSFAQKSRRLGRVCSTIFARALSGSSTHFAAALRIPSRLFLMSAMISTSTSCSGLESPVTSTGMDVVIIVFVVLMLLFFGCVFYGLWKLWQYSSALESRIEARRAQRQFWQHVAAPAAAASATRGSESPTAAWPSSPPQPATSASAPPVSSPHPCAAQPSTVGGTPSCKLSALPHP